MLDDLLLYPHQRAMLEALEGQAMKMFGGGRGRTSRVIMVSLPESSNNWVRERFMKAELVEQVVEEVDFIIVDEWAKFATDELFQAVEAARQMVAPDISNCEFKQCDEFAGCCGKHPYTQLPCQDCQQEDENILVYNQRQTARLTQHNRRPRTKYVRPMQNGSR